MQVIPVLDLLNGLVVHAKKGDRRNYLPVDSQLCPSSNPTELISCLLSLYDFKCIYIADLDALQYQGNNSGIVETICQNYPELGNLVGYRSGPDKSLFKKHFPQFIANNFIY